MYSSTLITSPARQRCIRRYTRSISGELSKGDLGVVTAGQPYFAGGLKNAPLL
jgi:hypothetical protein